MAEFSSRLPGQQDAQPDSGFTSKYIPVPAAPEPIEPPAWEEIKQSEDYKKLTYPEQVNLARQWGDETKQYASRFEDHTPELDAQIDDFVNKDAVDVPARAKVIAGLAGAAKGAGAVAGATLGGIGGVTLGPVGAVAGGVAGGIAGSELVGTAFEKMFPTKVPISKELAPGYAATGEYVPAVATGLLGAAGLATAGKTLFAELGAKKAAEEMGKRVGTAAITGAGLGTAIRTVTGGSVTPGTIAEDALFGALYSGLSATTRVKGYNAEEFKDLNYRVKNGTATKAEGEDWVNILNEARAVGAKNVQRAERTSVKFGNKNIVEKTRFQQGEQPIEVKPYYEPLPSAPTTPSTEIELSRQPQARPMKPATVVTPEALPESGVRGNVRGTQADTAEMQRRGIPTNIQAEFTDLTPAARRQNVFSVESQGINPDAIAPSTRGLQGEIVREGPIVTPRTQLPSGERLALPAEGEPRPRTAALEAAKVIELEKGMEERIRQSPQGGYGLKTELGKVAVPEQAGASYSDPGQQYLEWQKNINKSGSKYLAAADYDENKNWEKEGGIKIDNSYYSTIVSGDTRIALSSSGLYLRRGKVAQSYEADIDKNGNQIYTVERIVTDPKKRGTGSASNALKNLTDIADKSNVTLQLEPAVVESLSKKGQKALTFQQLGDWYKRNGFVPKFEGSNSVLIREPKQAVSKSKIPRPMGGAAGQGGFITSESFEVPRKLLQNYMTTNGALGKELFDIVEGQKTNREAMYASIRFATRDVKNALKLVNKRPVATPEQNKLISDYMSGNSELKSLPSQLRAPVKVLRDQLDTLSTKLMSEEGLLSERSKEIFSSNIGSYLNRSYEKFDNPNFDMDTLQKRDPALFAKSVEYVKNQMATEAKDEMEDYARRLKAYQDNANPGTSPPLAPESYIQQIYKTGNVPQDRLMGEVQRIIEEGSAKSGEAKPFNPESYGVSKKLGILKTRKAIPEEIRYLMGEYTDPLVRYTKSATKMVNLFTSHRTLMNLKEAGFRNGLFFDYPAPNTVAFASEGSEVLAPLNGVYMEKSVADAIKGFGSADKAGLVYQTFAKLNAFYKWSKTVGSYKGQIRNFLFNIPIEVQNGNFTLLESGKSTRAILADFGVPQADTPAMRAYLRRAMALGVYNNAKFDELNAMLRDAHADGGSISSFVERYGVPKFITNPAGSIIDFANFAYRSGDNFYKLTAWENEIKQLMDGKGLSRQDAEIEAAERVSNTRPTYERLAPLLKKFRTSPFGKNFISWNAERIRNSYWTAKYAIEDMRTPGMRKYGLKRAIGSILAYSIYGAAVKIALSSLGKKKEDVDALKKFAPNYQKDSILMPISFDPKTHNVKYIDLSFSDPFDVYRQPINAFKSEKALDAGLFTATANLVGNFFGLSVPVDVAINMASNKRTTGQAITNPQASPQKKFYDYAEYALRSFEPSSVTDIRNLYFAIKGEPDPYLGKYGRMPSLTENISSYAGLRAQTINIDQALQFRASRFNDDIGKSTSLFTEKYMAPGKQNRLTMEAGTGEMLQSREKLFKDMHETYLSALRWGLNSNDAIQAMRKGGMSRYNIMGVVNGEIPQFQIGRGMQRNLMYTNPEDMQKRQEIANELLQEQ